MEVQDYIKPIQAYLKRFLPKEKEEPVVTTRVSINLSATDITLIEVNRTTDAFELLAAESMAFEDLQSLPLVLSGLVERFKLDATPASWVMPLDDYQLFLIESPPVPQNEFASALNWRVRSLISYPIEEAIIDYFPLPAKKSAPDNPMLGVVTTRFNQLSMFVDILKKSGLKLSVIDIPELTLRNLTALYEDDEKSTAFLYFYEKVIILNISRQKTLYFTRRINRPTATDSTHEAEQISLEIMRYFDFFQSKWRYPSPSRVFIACESGDPSILAKSLSEQLLLKVEPYTLKSIILNPEKKPLVEGPCLLALGAAIREGDK